MYWHDATASFKIEYFIVCFLSCHLQYVCALDSISCVARKLFSVAPSPRRRRVCWNMKWQPTIVGFNSNKVVAFASLSKMTRESWLLSHVIRSLYLTFHWLRREYTGGRARADYARMVRNDNLEICCVHVCEEIEWQKKKYQPLLPSPDRSYDNAFCR